MKLSRIVPTACATLLLTAACSSETYENVPIDIVYRSTATAGLEIPLRDGHTVTVQQAGIAIGFTRIHLCDDQDLAMRWNPLRFLALPVAHAHSPSTPTSSGIPVILSTDLDDTQQEDLVASALRPVPNVSICSVEVQLLNADDDGHMFSFFPEIEGYASAAIIDGELVGSFAGKSALFSLDPPLRTEGEIRFEISLLDENWQHELSSLHADELADVQALSDALQDAAMNALRLDLVQHLPANE